MPLRDFEKEFSVAVKSILNAIKNGRVSHAYLLHCDDEELADSFSLALAQAVSCSKKEKDSSDACGECYTCKTIRQKVYPELFFLVPASKMRKITIGEDENEINSLRWFQSLFYFSAIYNSGKKIGIIKEADCMMAQAQNAFLKTLEEPPADSFFILYTSNPSALLPTIRSRCQRITLLRNSQNYDFAERNEVLTILQRLCSVSKELIIAEQSSFELNAIFSTLNQKAEQTVKERMVRDIEEIEDSNGKAIKGYEKRLEAAIQAEYLGMRGKILSLIHTYFVLSYLTALGVDNEFSKAHEEIHKFIVRKDERTAFRWMKTAEDFLYTMKLNVREHLALKTLCYSIIFNQRLR